jgi:hypothetical protein
MSPIMGSVNLPAFIALHLPTSLMAPTNQPLDVHEQLWEQHNRSEAHT